MEPHSRIANKKEVNFPSLGEALRSTADLPLEGGWVSVPKWERGACDQAQMITKRYLGLTFCHSLPGELAQCGFHRTLQPLLLAAARRKTPCRVNGVWSPELHPFPQPFPSSCALAPVLPQGLCLWIAGLHALLQCWEVVFVSSATAIYKQLTVPGLGIVEVPGHRGLADTHKFRLHAESRHKSWGN